MTDSGQSSQVAVSNSSPLICLSKAGLLDVLGKVYSSVVVPFPVLDEISRGPDGQTILKLFDSFDWVKVENIEISPEILEWNLGKGEASVISFALKQTSMEVLTDDRLANRCANVYQLQTKGTLGILVSARRKGIIKELRPNLEKLIQSGLWVSDELIKKVLRSVGE